MLEIYKGNIEKLLKFKIGEKLYTAYGWYNVLAYIVYENMFGYMTDVGSIVLEDEAFKDEDEYEDYLRQNRIVQLESELYMLKNNSARKTIKVIKPKGE